MTANDTINGPDRRLATFYEEIQDRRAERSECRITREIAADGKRYVGAEVIGRGGMKEILRVHDRMSGRDVALARLVDERPAYVESFLHEARITAALEHPNIVPVYDVGIADDAFFTMKLLSGDTLEQILDCLRAGETNVEAFSLPRLLDVFERICDAVAYAHAQGVVHLDLKPANIYVDAYGEVLVCDWGLARRLEDPLQLADSPSHNADPGRQYDLDQRTGTPGYMAPEQIDVRHGLADERTDVFALGAVLYSLLTYEAPFSGENIEQIHAATQSGQFVLPHLRSPQLSPPAGLEAVCTKALQPDANARYQSVDELQQDVRKYLDGFATLAEDAGFATHFVLLLRRHSRACAAIAAVIVLIVGLTVWFVGQIKHRESRTRNALMVAEAAQRDTEAALRLYKKEQAEKDAISTVAATYIGRSVMRSHPELSIDKARTQAQTALKAAPESPDAHTDMAILDFIDQRFNAAANHFALGNDDQYAENLLALSKRFGALKDDDERLSGADLSALLKILIDYDMPWTTTSLLTANGRRATNLSDHVVAVSRVLELDNPKQAEWNVDFTVDEDHNRLSKISLGGHAELRSLRALGGLKITELDLSDTGVGTLQEIQSAEVERLNISRAAISTAAIVLAVPGLKQVTLAKGQFSDVEERKLRNRVTVVIAE